MPKPDMVLPVISYATLAGAVVTTLKVLQPVVGHALPIAITGFSVGLPVVTVLTQLALMGGSGVAKTLGGAETSDPKLTRLANEAAAAVGVPSPRVFEVNSREPNAFAAAGFRGRDTSVTVTTGLREILTTDELKAVLAHEMGHLRHRDVTRNIHIAAATAGLGGIYQTGRWLLDAEMRRSAREGKEEKKKKDKDEGSSAPLALGLMAGGLVLEGSAHLLRLTASRHSEIKADRAAAEAYGAQTIIDALKKIDRAAVHRPADLRKGWKGKAYAFAMISDGPALAKKENTLLCAISKVGEALRTHPTLERRIKALEKAAADGSVPSGRASWPSALAWWRW